MARCASGKVWGPRVGPAGASDSLRLSLGKSVIVIVILVIIVIVIVIVLISY